MIFDPAYGNVSNASLEQSRAYVKREIANTNQPLHPSYGDRILKETMHGHLERIDAEQARRDE